MRIAILHPQPHPSRSSPAFCSALPRASLRLCVELTLALSIACSQQPPPNRSAISKSRNSIPRPPPSPSPSPSATPSSSASPATATSPTKSSSSSPSATPNPSSPRSSVPKAATFTSKTCTCSPATKPRSPTVRREIGTWLPSVAKEDDRVLIYFAGHGFMSGARATSPPSISIRDRIADTGYPMDELGSVIGGKIKAKSKILLTDACHSGAITPEDTENLNSRFGDLSKSLFSLTASRAREQSFEVADLKGGHGVFTYYVVQGMEGAADSIRRRRSHRRRTRRVRPHPGARVHHQPPKPHLR